MNGRNQNFQLSHQKPSGVAAPSSQKLGGVTPSNPKSGGVTPSSSQRSGARLPAHGAPLRADHAIGTLGNGITISIEIYRITRPTYLAIFFFKETKMTRNEQNF